MADFLTPSPSSLLFTERNCTAEQLTDLADCPADSADAQHCSHGQLHYCAGPRMLEPAVVNNRQAVSPSLQQQPRQPCQTEQVETMAGAHDLAVAQVMPDPVAARVQHNQGPSQSDRSNLMQPSDHSTAGGAAAMQPFGCRAGGAQRDWTVHGEITSAFPVKTAPAGSKKSSGPASSNQSGASGTVCDVDAPIPAAQDDASAQVPSDNACKDEGGPDSSEASGAAASDAAPSDTSEHE